MKGLCRFKLGSEQLAAKGFRKATVNWSNFKEDFEIKNLKNKSKRKEFMDILKPFLKKISVSADWEAIDVSSDEDIVNSIAMGCPFDQIEKQALLEAQNIDERIEILLSLMKMSINENKRLQFLFKDYLSEEKLSKNTVLSRFLEGIDQKKVKKSKKDFKIDRKNIKKFVEKWEKGMTTNEITKELQEESLTIKVGKRKRYNLKNRD